ncbi:MAG: hypothetical protein HKN76_00435 [Saprospiraceae bacterium]|nr:hypothetical protein [Saprospiraceae bacterium]
MALKSLLILPFAKKIAADVQRWSAYAGHWQGIIFRKLLKKAAATRFGLDHNFSEIRTYDDFISQVPIRDYEGFKYYIELAKSAEKDVLWPGVPEYFAKTSGTTSGVKYIPMTRESTPYHVNSARNSLFTYIAQTGNRKFLDGKMLYLSGTPQLEDTNGIKTGRLSGIVNHQIPNWAKSNKLPGHQINCIEDWEEKVKSIVVESAGEDLRLIGGIPPWVQMYYEELLAYTGKERVIDVFPNLTLFVYGGVNYEPYRSKLESLVGKSIDSIETFPASEGFFAFQDQPGQPGLLLNVNAGMFFEFVPVEEIHAENPSRINLEDVQLGVAYVLIVSSNAGLWAYNVGDTIEFVDLAPPRIVVTGRIKHFISAFGEHVIGKEVEQAMMQASQQLHLEVIEFTVAPQVAPPSGLPYHEWLVELANEIDNLEQMEQILDKSVQDQNIYYKDLIEGKILRPAKVTLLKRHAFQNYMKSIGKLGGQNKVPRLSNDRKIADKLISAR